jgi:hypothetical protein
MDGEKVALVICLTLFIVVGVNAAIYAMLRGGSTLSQIEILRRASQRARQPWKPEDEALEELSKRVAELRRESDEARPGDE